MPVREQTDVSFSRWLKAHRYGFASKRLAGLIGLLVALPLCGSAGEFAITSSVIGGGGGSCTGGDFFVQGTIGQPASGTLLGGSVELEAGFWNRAVLVGAIGEPRLQYLAAGNDMILFWAAEPSGFVLESSPSLNPPTVWSPTTDIPVEMDGLKFVTVPADRPMGFYRLRQP